MTKRAQSVLEQALKLSARERVEIANELFESVEESSLRGLSPEWREEIERRVENLLSGKTKPIAFARVMAKLRRNQARDQRARGKTASH